MEINTAYINSTMNEVHDLCNDLYEAMMDSESVDHIIKTLKRALSDIQKSYDGESQNQSH
jgi:hypothetical protein